MNYQLLNGADLAYIGDAYYELEVRKHLLEQNLTKPKDLRKASIKYVSATAHKFIFTKIQDQLTTEEMKIFLKGRNNAPHCYRKNVDKTAYLISTGLEAIIGYLYLARCDERLKELMDLIFKIVESGE